jgi:putative IMPACT (imprinted ancient) family translation regulator
MNTFRTIAKKSEGFYKEKGSKFIAYAFPINDADESKEKFAEISELHPKARHICTALLVGKSDDEYYLANDDGEPANSAGAPILGQIRSYGITNAFVAVVRYFGGTKLGISGLIHAYKAATADAFENNQIITVEPTFSFRFEVGYDILGEILSVIDRNNLTAVQEHRAKTALIRVICKEDNLAATKGLFGKYGLDYS